MIPFIPRAPGIGTQQRRNLCQATKQKRQQSHVFDLLKGTPLSRLRAIFLRLLSRGLCARRCEAIDNIGAEGFDDSVKLRTVENLFLEQLLGNFMEQTEVSLQ